MKFDKRLEEKSEEGVISYLEPPEDMFELVWQILFEPTARVPKIIDVKKYYTSDNESTTEYDSVNSDDNRSIVDDRQFSSAYNTSIGVRGITKDELEYAKDVFDKLHLKNSGIIEAPKYEDSRYPYKIVAEIPEKNGNPISIKQYLPSIGENAKLSWKKSTQKYGAAPKGERKPEEENSYHLNLPKSSADYFRFGRKVRGEKKEESEGYITMKFKKINEEYTDRTKNGWEIIKIFKDYNRGYKLVIVYRPTAKDYVVGSVYDERTGEWGQGHYGFKTAEDAEKFVRDNYSVDKDWYKKDLETKFYDDDTTKEEIEKEFDSLIDWMLDNGYTIDDVLDILKGDALDESKKSCKNHCQMKESAEDTVSWNVNDRGLLSIYIGDWKVADITDCGKMSSEEVENLIEDILYDMGYNWKEDGTVELLREAKKPCKGCGKRFPMKEARGMHGSIKNPVADAVINDDISYKTLEYLARKLREEIENLDVEAECKVDTSFKNNANRILVKVTNPETKKTAVFPVKVEYDNWNGFHFFDPITRKDWKADELEYLAISLARRV